MFHGPLVYLVTRYMGHAPFTESDIDLFLQQYGPSSDIARALKEDFLLEAREHIYPSMNPRRSDVWIQRRLFEPLSWMAFLYRRLVKIAKERDPVPLIIGAVERSDMDEFLRTVLLRRVFAGMDRKHRTQYFNEAFGRKDLTTASNVVRVLRYTDPLLLWFLMQPGQVTEGWAVDKFGRLGEFPVPMPDDPTEDRVDFSILQPGRGAFGFPRVIGCYVHVSETREPIRVEVFEELGAEQPLAAARRTYLYSRLLPGYGFPVGLNIADKYAKVPAWLTDAYGKLIRYHLSESLQRGEISDTQLRRILIQAIYMTHRDWLFRPEA